jgi:hypothetical protein
MGVSHGKPVTVLTDDETRTGDGTVGVVHGNFGGNSDFASFRQLKADGVKFTGNLRIVYLRGQEYGHSGILSAPNSGSVRIGPNLTIFVEIPQKFRIGRGGISRRKGQRQKGSAHLQIHGSTHFGRSISHPAGADG